MLLRAAALAFFTLIVLSCKKESVSAPDNTDPVTTDIRPGVPDHPDSIHGYMYAGYHFLQFTKAHTSTITVVAAFGDPARKLTNNFDHITEQITQSNSNDDSWRPNVRPARLWFNSVEISANQFGSTFFWLQSATNIYLIDNRAQWTVPQTVTFPAISENLSGYMPVINDTLRVVSLTKGNELSIKCNDYFSQWDSAFVKIFGPYGQPTIQRSTYAGAPTIVLSTNDLDRLAPDTLYVHIELGVSKYLSRTVNGKRFLFELAKKVEGKLNVRKN